MKLKKWLSLAAATVVLFSLSACGNSANAVYVQSVAELSNWGGIAAGDRFAGMVVSENTTEINKDGGKSIKELLVKEGQVTVEEGKAGQGAYLSAMQAQEMIFSPASPVLYQDAPAGWFPVSVL